MIHSRPKKTPKQHDRYQKFANIYHTVYPTLKFCTPLLCFSLLFLYPSSCPHNPFSMFEHKHPTISFLRPILRATFHSTAHQTMKLNDNPLSRLSQFVLPSLHTPILNVLFFTLYHHDFHLLSFLSLSPFTPSSSVRTCDAMAVGAVAGIGNSYPINDGNAPYGVGVLVERSLAFRRNL